MMLGSVGGDRRKKRIPTANQPSTLILGIYHIVLGIFLLSLLIALWPNGKSTNIYLWFWNKDLGNLEIRYMLMVLTMGAWGGYFHSATSFATRTGHKTLEVSWNWWYILRPFVGSVIAFVFYTAVRGGFLSGASTTEDLNVFGTATIAGICGMFSQTAADKLKEVFETLFRPQQSQQKPSESTHAPSITSITPNKVPSGVEATELSLVGQGFGEKSVVRIKDADMPTTFISATELKASLPKEILLSAGDLEVTVANEEGVLATPAILSVID